MQVRTTLTAAMAAIALLTAAGCAVTRGRETVGAYIDDATITTQVKSGFATNTRERGIAESIAMVVDGVIAFKNEIAV